MEPRESGGGNVVERRQCCLEEEECCSKGSSAGPYVVEVGFWWLVRPSADSGARVLSTVGRKVPLNGTVDTAHPSQPNLRIEQLGK